MKDAELRQAVEQALPFFQTHLHDNDDDLIAALVASGTDKPLATRIVQFTPIAFTRVFFERSKVQFAETYFRMKSDGSLGAECRLDEEPVFKAAAALARNRDIAGPSMLFVTHRSGAFQAIHQAMRQGAQLNGLMVSSPILVEREPASDPPAKPPEPPWWRFWKK